ncbi:Fic family protein [Pontibacter saemangeumensis]|uniref:Fic family protein n=1 Tax=Pontibacter saemangeumensis TaxID=1084525 RepID=A0ABP8LMI1_9BACT
MAIQLEKYKAGHWQPGTGYKYFLPVKVNDQWQWADAQLNTLLEKASIRLGELNSYARLVPNIDLFISLHVTKEAVVSSRIEGTQTNIAEAMLPEEEITPERRNDWKEVNNYTHALNEAIKSLSKLPLSSRLLRQAHQKLMTGVRGEHKLPGAFRSSQNWIGGSGPADAIFVPPAHVHVDELMGDLENFLHNDQISVPALVRIGIAHYQFETIHPFLDGNGRIGRLLITLFLVDQDILHQPLLYLSSYFEKNKSHYYDNLTRVREKNDMLHWLKYFLIGVEKTAQEAVETLSKVITLKQDLENSLHREWGRRTQSALKLLLQLFEHPVVTVKEAQSICQLSKKAAGELIESFEKAGILVEQTGQSRNRIYLFAPYVELFKG